MRGILLDIEGTTTPIAFVYDVLFPYVRRHAANYVRDADLSRLKLEYEQDVRQGNAPPEWSTDPLPYIQWLMDQDRKSTALKNIQGEIWLQGFQNGELKGEVFEDVLPALERWRKQELDVRIFSSGSVLAQRLLFSTTRSGDLTKFLRGYYDTTTGPKGDPDSYRRIADSFGLTPHEILFLSDITRELDAARDAGMQTRLCVRPGNHPQPAHQHEIVRSFHEID
jgi:enolase-phosphatase E1